MKPGLPRRYSALCRPPVVKHEARHRFPVCWSGEDEKNQTKQCKLEKHHESPKLRQAGTCRDINGLVVCGQWHEHNKT